MSQFTINANKTRTKDRRTDVYLTPATLVHVHLAQLRNLGIQSILDPFRGSGAYYDAFPEFFPNATRDWCEIEQDRDFFEFASEVDCIASNPPYSLMSKIIEKSISLKPKYISFLLCQHNITPHRIQRFNDAGYFIAGYFLCRVDRWFGTSVILTMSNQIGENLVGFDLTKHRMEVRPRAVEAPARPSV